MKKTRRIKFKKKSFKKGLHIRKKGKKISSFHELKVPTFVGSSMTSQTSKTDQSGHIMNHAQPSNKEDELTQKYGLPGPFLKKKLDFNETGEKKEVKKEELSEAEEKKKKEKKEKKEEQELEEGNEAKTEMERIRKGRKGLGKMSNPKDFI